MKNLIIYMVLVGVLTTNAFATNVCSMSKGEWFVNDDSKIQGKVYEGETKSIKISGIDDCFKSAIKNSEPFPGFIKWTYNGTVFKDFRGGAVPVETIKTGWVDSKTDQNSWIKDKATDLRYYQPGKNFNAKSLE